MLSSSSLNQEDELKLKYLINLLQECEMIKHMNMSNLSLVTIAEYSLGYIVSCECGFGEILILPSMETYFETFKCRDCKTGICATIKCNHCIDEENSFSIEPYLKQYDEPYPLISCSKCVDDASIICSNCSFICKGCLDVFCKQYHLTEICPTCDAEYCPKEEWEFSTCIGCNRINCSCCKYILCSYFKTWIDCGEYNACKFCYSSNIMQHYQDPFLYKSCMKITNMLLKKNKKYLSIFIFIPIHIIQMIAMFLNNSSDVCDVSIYNNNNNNNIFNNNYQ